MLDERKQKILRSVISTYIATGEPVGSKALLDMAELHVSSATIRSEMLELERLGLLCKPHTSAGSSARPSPRQRKIATTLLTKVTTERLWQ